jgi:hypothetical protein
MSADTRPAKAAKHKDPVWLAGARGRARRNGWRVYKHPSGPNMGPNDRALLLGVIDLASRVDARTGLVLRRCAAVLQQVIDESDDDIFVDQVVAVVPPKAGEP